MSTADSSALFAVLADARAKVLEIVFSGSQVSLTPIARDTGRD